MKWKFFCRQDNEKVLPLTSNPQTEDACMDWFKVHACKLAGTVCCVLVTAIIIWQLRVLDTQEDAETGDRPGL